MKNILMIDDDEEMCLEISEILQDEGFQIHFANDGIKGLQILENDTFDLLLLDLKIPGLTGFEILRKLRIKNNKIKIFVLTGRPYIKNLPRELTDEEKNEEEILKLADQVIQKPFKITHLLQQIKQI
jgi:DNA-binding response OmpR family regulator